jgi:hypothetical protein
VRTPRPRYEAISFHEFNIGGGAEFFEPLDILDLLDLLELLEALEVLVFRRMMAHPGCLEFVYC